MTFLQKLKSSGVISDQSCTLTSKENEKDEILQLDVDVLTTDNFFIIYAQAAGADMHDVHITIEGEDNIVIIEGQRNRPADLVAQMQDREVIVFVKECQWGKFYRRIILPESVDIKRAEADIKDGILKLKLPFLYNTNNKS